MKKKVFAKAIRNHIILLAAGAIAGLILLVLVHLLPIEPMREHVYWSMDMIEREFDNEILKYQEYQMKIEHYSKKLPLNK